MWAFTPVLSFICVYVGCKGSDKDFYYIDLLKSQEVLYYSQFVDSITYIPLETNDECLIGKVKDIRITDSAIFILDEKLNRICIFDKEGKYRGKIDKQGEGPGEYTVLKQFYVDQRKNCLYLHDIYTSRMLIYDMQENFKEHISLDFSVEDFVVLRSGDFLFYRDWGRNRGEDTGFLLADSRGKIKRKLVANDKRYLRPLSNEWEFTEVGEGVMFISPVFNNIVYEYTQKDSLIVRYPFKILPIPKKKYIEDDSFMNLTDFVRTGAIFSEKWINLTYWSSEYDLRIVQYSKERNEYYVAKDMENDIDGREIRGRGSETRNNTFTFLVDSEENPEESNPVVQILHLK